LHGWVTENRTDGEAIELLCGIDEGAQDWDALVESATWLVGVSDGEERVAAVLRLAEACAQAGRPEDAQVSMEQTLEQNPDSTVVREHLKVLYERMGAWSELAAMTMYDVTQEEDEGERHALLCKAGLLYLRAGNPEAGLPPLEEAVRIRPDDHDTTILLVDTLIADERYPDAGQILERAIESHTRRRSPELAQLQQRMATLAERAGDRTLQMQWLNAAMESDKSNGEITAQLAYLAMELKDYDVATNALRVVTLSREEGPISKAMAFLLQAKIAYEKGETRRALLWARKAKSLDQDLAEADAFLSQLGG
ncbi:MAG: tetratricopeptide repeat protein, partial [Myxococcales bacterium]|nr:tetratricopeptide repeat protein [Myxococcales bacterium]